MTPAKTQRRTHRKYYRRTMRDSNLKASAVKQSFLDDDPCFDVVDNRYTG